MTYSDGSLASGTIQFVSVSGLPALLLYSNNMIYLSTAQSMIQMFDDSDTVMMAEPESSAVRDAMWFLRDTIAMQQKEYEDTGSLPEFRVRSIVFDEKLPDDGRVVRRINEMRNSMLTDDFRRNGIFQLTYQNQCAYQVGDSQVIFNHSNGNGEDPFMESLSRTSCGELEGWKRMLFWENQSYATHILVKGE